MVKYETVIGTIGKTHGVSSDSAPIETASQRKSASDWELLPAVTGLAGAATAGAAAVSRPFAAGGAADAPTGAAATGAPVMSSVAARVSSRGGRQYRSVHV